MLQQPFVNYRLTSPQREMARLQQEINRLFSNEPFTGQRPNASSYPAMNAWTNEDSTIVITELPGFSLEDIDISVVGNSLTLSGSRQPEALGEDGKYHRRERSYGKFSRTIQLPYNIEMTKVEAIYEKGILHISLPRAEADKPKKIVVKSV